MSSKNIVVVVETNCRGCPFLEVWDNVHSQHATDWHCKKVEYGEGSLGKKIAGYIEGSCDEPKGFPSWCPFPDTEEA